MIVQRWTGRETKLLRHALRMSIDSFADYLGISSRAITKWETPGTTRTPRHDMQEILDTALVRATDKQQERFEASLALDGNGSGQGNSGFHDRLEFALARPGHVDLVTAALLREKVRHLEGAYDSTPSTLLLGSAGQLHGQVVCLREQTTSARVRKALFEVEAESATFMGQLTWDASQRRDHRRPILYLDQAIHAAHQIRDASARSYAVLRKSFVALYGERKPVKGRELAHEAAEIAGPVSPSLTGLALLHVAESNAMTGQRRNCESALASAESQLDLLSTREQGSRKETDTLDLAAGSYTASEFTRLAGSCYLFLGEHKRAQPILEKTVETVVGEPISQAIALGNLGLSLIRQRRPDEAAVVLHQTIDAVALTRGGGGLNVAFRAGRELAEWRHEPWAQEIHDRLLDLMVVGQSEDVSNRGGSADG
jgi:transcriptional regulator with XRE-family HTH domain